VSRTHAYELLDAGEDRVDRESLDPSIRLGVDVMRTLGVPAHEAHRRGAMFRAHDERALREMRRLRDDHSSCARSVRQQTEALEALMEAEGSGKFHLENDAAWDTEPIRKEFSGESDEPPITTSRPLSATNSRCLHVGLPVYRRAFPSRRGNAPSTTP
jgi:hypothetical protein